VDADFDRLNWGLFGMGDSQSELTPKNVRLNFREIHVRGQRERYGTFFTGDCKGVILTVHMHCRRVYSGNLNINNCKSSFIYSGVGQGGCRRLNSETNFRLREKDVFRISV